MDVMIAGVVAVGGIVGLLYLGRDEINCTYEPKTNRNLQRDGRGIPEDVAADGDRDDEYGSLGA